MKIVIAPSKTMKYQKIPFVGSEPLFQEETQYLTNILKQYNDEQLCQLMKISYKQATQVYQYFHEEQTAHPAFSITEETRYANSFAKDILETYYYWNNEISKDLSKLDPNTNSDPIATVEEIRYHDGKNQIDKWTMLTDNMDEFTSSVEGGNYYIRIYSYNTTIQ